MTDVVPVLEQQSTGRKRLVLAIGVLGVLTAGIFAALAIGGSSTTAGGADSPEEAYQQLLQAISDEDLLGAAELVLPSERETLVQPLFDLVRRTPAPRGSRPRARSFSRVRCRLRLRRCALRNNDVDRRPGNATTGRWANDDRGRAKCVPVRSAGARPVAGGNDPRRFSDHE